MKAQVWYVDYFFALLLFSTTVLFFYNYFATTELVPDNSLDDLLMEAKSMSSMLMSEGYPRNWTVETVKGIGLLQNNRIDQDKMKAFYNMTYDQMKGSFSTKYDFVIYLENSTGGIYRFDDNCAIGPVYLNTKTNNSMVRAAYFYQAEDEMKEQIHNLSVRLNITIDTDWSSAAHLLDNIYNYTLIVMETPKLSAAQALILENYTRQGGLLFLSERILNPATGDILGVEYIKRSAKYENATIIRLDDRLGFDIGDHITCYENPTVEDTFVPGAGEDDAENFITLARFDSDNSTAIARWNYGAGTVYYFSDFDTSYMGGNFQYEIRLALETFLYGLCTGIELNVTADKVAKIERYPLFTEELSKLVVYVWY